MKRRRRSCSAALASGRVEGGAGDGLATRSPLELEGEGERRGIEREMRGNEGEMAPGGAREERERRGRDGDRALRLGLEGGVAGLGPA